MRCLLGRVDRGNADLAFTPPIQSLSPCWGSPQRQGQAKRCPWECLRVYEDWGVAPPDPCGGYPAGRVDRGTADLAFTPPIRSLSLFWGTPQRQGQAKRSPLECIRAGCRQWACRLLNFRKRYPLGRVDRAVNCEGPFLGITRRISAHADRGVAPP